MTVSLDLPLVVFLLLEEKDGQEKLLQDTSQEVMVTLHMEMLSSLGDDGDVTIW